MRLFLEPGTHDIILGFRHQPDGYGRSGPTKIDCKAGDRQELTIQVKRRRR